MEQHDLLAAWLRKPKFNLYPDPPDKTEKRTKPGRVVTFTNKPVLHREIIILRLNVPQDFSHNNLLPADISGYRSWNLDLPDDQILNSEDLSHHLLCVPLRDGSDGDFLFDSGWIK